MSKLLPPLSGVAVRSLREQKERDKRARNRKSSDQVAAISAQTGQTPTDNGPTIGECTECKRNGVVIALLKPGAEVCEDCI